MIVYSQFCPYFSDRVLCAKMHNGIQVSQSISMLTMWPNAWQRARVVKNMVETKWSLLVGSVISLSNSRSGRVGSATLRSKVSKVGVLECESWQPIVPQSRSLQSGGPMSF